MNPISAEEVAQYVAYLEGCASWAAAVTKSGDDNGDAIELRKAAAVLQRLARERDEKEAELKDTKDALVAARDKTYPRPAKGWQCFHCGEWFTTEASAISHFGESPHAMKERAEAAERELTEANKKLQVASELEHMAYDQRDKAWAELAEAKARLDRLDNFNLAAVEKYLKPGQTVVERMDHFHKEALSMLTLLKREKIRAETAEAAAAKAREERAWLIEMPSGRWGTGYFWRGFREYECWGTIEQAVRFARKEDADRVIAQLVAEDKTRRRDTAYEACEHIWDAALRGGKDT